MDLHKYILLSFLLLIPLARPIFGKSIFQQAQSLYKSGELTKAEQLYLRVRANDSHYPEALVRLGIIYYTTGRLSQAEQAFSKSLKYKESPVVYAYLAGVQFNQRKFVEAHNSALSALRIDPRCAQAYTALGMIYAATNDWPLARSAYQQSLRINPKDANTWYLLGTACFRRDDFTSAKRDFERALSLDPRQLRIYEDLARTLELLNKPSQTEAIFREAIRLNRQEKFPNSSILEAYGAFLSRQGRPAESLAQFREAVRLAPKDAKAHYEVANQLLRMRQWQEAAREGETALSRGESDYRVHYLLAQAYTALGQSAKAARQAQTAAALAEDARNKY
ncbi:MAG: tetratricopeptide repeat protein [Terriglobia bacterium]